MAEPQVTMSKSELTELLKTIQAGQAETLAAAIRAAREPNPLEQKAIDEQIEADKRRSKLMVELGKVEEQSMFRRKHGCSHSRVPQGQRNAGAPCPRGHGEWTTGGQLSGVDDATGRDVAHMLCTRCSWSWRWIPTLAEREMINGPGMLGMTPPTDDRVIWQG